ncbi:MAG: rhodanese-like domain-containing protein [Bacteroidota bacterium]
MSQKDFDKKINSLLSHTVPLVNENDLKSSFASEPILLDTRSLKEFEVSHLKGARFIDYEHFNPEMVSDIDKNKSVVLYCSVGYRSEKIGEKLQELGFKNVYNLYGGIFDWKNKDNAVVNQNNIETDSVHTYNKNWSKWLKRGVKVYE